MPLTSFSYLPIRSENLPYFHQKTSKTDFGMPIWYQKMGFVEVSSKIFGA